MQNFFYYRMVIFCIISLSFVLSSCAHHTPIRSGENGLPDTIKIDFTISNYQIVDHRIVNSGRKNIDLEYTGRYSDGKNVYFRLDSYPRSNSYWVIKMLDISDGNWTGEAKIIRPYYENDQQEAYLYQLPAPPNEIGIDMRIVDGYLKYHSINDFDERTFGLYLKDVSGMGDKKICSIKSSIYKSDEWKFILPKEDGYFRVVAKRTGN